MASKRIGGSQMVTRRAVFQDLNNVPDQRIKQADIKGKGPIKAVRKLPQTKKVLQDPETPVPMEMSMVASPVAFSTQNIPPNVTDIDTDDQDNPQLVSDYVNDIYKYLWYLEAKFPVNYHYLDNQTEVTSKMRSVLVDWIVQIHQRFSLLQETLFLTVSILDRFLQEKMVKRSRLQLVGVTAMFIACKYEEMYAPDIGDFVYMTDGACPKQDILRMELMMLDKLKFGLGRPLPIHFLRRNSKAGNVDTQMHTMAKYLMELTLVDYELAHIAPSLIAAAALYISLELLENSSWTTDLEYYSKYTIAAVLPVARRICYLLQRLETTKLKAAFTKFSSSKFMKIAISPELKSAFVVKMAQEA